MNPTLSFVQNSMWVQYDFHGLNPNGESSFLEKYV